MGKFNAGQKLYAAFVIGAIPVMLMTGGVMRWYDPFPLAWRTGATFVHDWIATILLFTIVGHIVMATRGASPGRTGGGPGPSRGARLPG